MAIFPLLPCGCNGVASDATRSHRARVESRWHLGTRWHRSRREFLWPGALGAMLGVRRSSTEGSMTRLIMIGALLASASLLTGPVHAQPKASADIKDASGKSLGE